MNHEKNDENKIYFIPLAQNWISMLGFWLAMAFIVGETIIIGYDFFYGSDNPYTGILIYLVGPGILIFGLLLVPLGMWIEYRRRKKNLPKKKYPVLDLNNHTHRRYIAIFIVVTIIFLILSSVGSYQAYHVTESTEFCGKLCHFVMKPEFTAYQHSSHARVACVQCHIGPGADWYVRSKISGLRQVWAVATETYDLPIDTPIKHLRPARETCEQCHWPEKFYENIEKNMTFYASDEENTPYKLSMLLHVGGSSDKLQTFTGIHWHIARDHTLEYYATDEDRQDIVWIKVTYDDGRIHEYIDKEAEDFDPSAIPPEKIRTMDCIDCHNRPSHVYQSPLITINQAMDYGLISAKIPYIKDTLIGAIEGQYETTEEAMNTIQQKVMSEYKDLVAEGKITKASVTQAIEQAKLIFQNNFFPEQNVNWTKYPNNIGHFQFPGCYRCHDGQHMSAEGKVIEFDNCNLCHMIIRQEEGWKEAADLKYKVQDFNHPRGYGDMWKGQNCHECHGPGMM